MDLSLRLRLSVMMFLEYFIWGAWGVVIFTFLSSLPTVGGLDFPGGYVAMIGGGVLAIGAMISPLFVGLVVDRLFATEKVLAVLHLAGALLLFWTAHLCDQKLPVIRSAFESAAQTERIGARSLSEAAEAARGAPAADPLQKEVQRAIQRVNERPEVAGVVRDACRPLFWLMFVYALCYMPTLTLTNSLSFRNLGDPDKYFGGIRVLGTIGWIVAGVVVGFVLNAVSSQPLYLAAGSSALLGLFSLALPHTPPSRQARTLGDTLGLPALAMLKDRSFLVFVIASFWITIPLAFYFTWGNPFLQDLHIPHATGIQGILGQGSEIIFMLLLPVGLAWVGTKWMLAIGMLAWCVRYAVFATENKVGIIALGLPLHGVCYDFFFVVAYLYVDRQAPKQLRASAQAMITFVLLGAGMFVGNLLAGKTQEYYTVGDHIDWPKVWLVPLVIAAAVLVPFVLLFHERAAAPAEVPLTKVMEGLEPMEPRAPTH